MDRTQPFRFGPGSYPCQNPRCHIAYHPIPTCPYQLPEPSRPVNPRALDGRRRIEQLEREGRLPHVEPFPMWWIYLIPPALVVLLLLMLF